MGRAVAVRGQFAPAGRAAGLIGPECAVADDADDLTRLLAVFGRSTAPPLRGQRLPTANA